MNKEQIVMAVNAGLELLGPESEVSVPAKLNDGVFFLRQFLGNVAQGRLAITPTVQKDGDNKPPAEPPTPNRKTRRKAAAKKRSKKATKK